MVPILMTGNNITQPGDVLQKITLEDWMQKVMQPPAAIAGFIERLRTIRTLDETLYREQKKKLPYAVCGYFHPPVRRKENFASLQCFIIDLDHIKQQDTDITTLKNKLAADTRLSAAFASPGNDGLKLVYRLDSPCKDAALFSAFYKVFCKQLADQFQLQNMIDTRTHDQTLKEVQEFYENTDSILLVPVNTTDLRSMKIIGKEIHIQTLLDKPNTLFI
jgi:hypothetical protein